MTPPQVAETSHSDALSYAFAQANRVLISEHGEKLEVLHHDDLSFETILELNRHLKGREFSLRKVSDTELNKALRLAYEKDGKSTATQMNAEIGDTFDLTALADEIPQTTDLLDDSNDAPVIKLINAIITQAIKDQSSDVHLEVFEEKSSVRYRIDGFLHEALTLKREIHNALISRLKVMSQLDIAERRLPQDGRMSLRIGRQAIDVRVSILPTQHGERAVLRLLDKESERLDLKHLGMPTDLRRAFSELISRPNGVILVTGPTGSGKTTTLYSALSELDSDSLNILTVEDPIEYDIPNIGQTQINEKVGLNFADGLRSILRQDPDVVLVGEIRDVETAQIAIQASLTGHTVFSTLHTNSAIGAITRLIDMGVEPFLIASTLAGVLSQRLVRRPCNTCLQQRPLERSELELFSSQRIAPPTTLAEGEGCEICNYSGYQGRVGIFELVQVNKSTQRLIHAGESEQAIESALRENHHSLLVAGLQAVKNGDTTIDEVLRVTQVE